MDIYNFCSIVKIMYTLHKEMWLNEKSIRVIDTVITYVKVPFVRNVCVQEFLFDVLIAQGPNFVLMKMS